MAEWEPGGGREAAGLKDLWWFNSHIESRIELQACKKQQTEAARAWCGLLYTGL